MQVTMTKRFDFYYKMNSYTLTMFTHIIYHLWKGRYLSLTKSSTSNNMWPLFWDFRPFLFMKYRQMSKISMLTHTEEREELF